MIAFAFSFPAGRYHATPWGRHANEADVAWPPEPVRILRALIATWWRKADHQRFPKALLDELIDVLSIEPPVFHLPEAVHSHVRAFMPAPKDKKLIFDAFLRFDRGAKLLVGWRDVVLTGQHRELCAHLLERIGYLGRAESWACACIADDWDGTCNARPREADNETSGNVVPIDVAVPLTPKGWADVRVSLLPKLKGVKGAILPERLSEALALDTSEWQGAGWSSPPPLRRLVYDRPPIGAIPPRRRAPAVGSGTSQAPEVARFVLAGRPPPRIEDALRIGELTRIALMSGGGSPPPEFSGRTANGPQRGDPAHAHAFFLPEDADEDGLIDHVLVYCRYGFSSLAKQRLDQLTKLWRAHGRADRDGERGRKEWRLALEDIAPPEAFGRASALLRPSRTWTSVTPYLMPWHAKHHFGVREQITREIQRRGVFPTPLGVTVQDRSPLRRRAIDFHRARSRPGLSQPDRIGSFLTLTFENAVPGPFAFGFACHYGLGIFAAAD